MNVCVAGFYFNATLAKVLAECGMPVFYACHRQPPSDLPFSHAVIRNVGLEFGCYDYYLLNVWQGGDVLFMHDDSTITQEALDAIEGIEFDQAFLFGSVEEAEANGKAHGRAVFMSERLLQRLVDDGGFWYDEGPITSLVIPPTTADEPDYHNAGILIFRAWLESLNKEFNVCNAIAIKGLKNGYRGKL